MLFVNTFHVALLSGIVEYEQVMAEKLIRGTNKLCKYYVFYIQAPTVLKFMLNSPWTCLHLITEKNM